MSYKALTHPPSPPPERQTYPTTPARSDRSLQETHLHRARASLRQSLSQYSRFLRSLKPTSPTVERQTAGLQADLERLSTTLTKLDQTVVRIAVFGLVSRGKSAVLNALLGQKILQTGPLNGVTRLPQTVRWLPGNSSILAGSGVVEAIAPETAPDIAKVQVELIDTPGLDEIDGQTRAQMARDVARQADLILFVVAGDITRTEYQALCELRQAQKPLVLVFNKIDLYPEQTRQAIYQRLQELGSAGNRLQQLLSKDEIVMVAAEPAPMQVRVEWANGRVTHEWESPAPQIDELKQKILTILNQEGRSLLALNGLFQAREAEATIAHKILEIRNEDAEDLIWKFIRYKAIAIAVNPIAVLDVLGGTVADIAMIRALADLYGLPMTRHEAGKLWKQILLSSGSLLLGELGSGLLLGLGKSASAIASAAESSSSFSAYMSVAFVQAGIAGYGSYTVGRAVQTYLEQGCSWGDQGANTVIQDILNQVEPNTILYRLRQELSQYLN